VVERLIVATASKSAVSGIARLCAALAERAEGNGTIWTCCHPCPANNLGHVFAIYISWQDNTIPHMIFSTRKSFAGRRRSSKCTRRSAKVWTQQLGRSLVTELRKSPTVKRETRCGGSTKSLGNGADSSKDTECWDSPSSTKHTGAPKLHRWLSRSSNIAHQQCHNAETARDYCLNRKHCAALS
jgi:hypothetical protein